MRIVLLVIITLHTMAAATAADVAGNARIVDGDTIAFGSVIVRLYGIDAPENGQDCMRASGKKYNCGLAAEKHLKRLARGRAQCSGNQFDDYGRLIGICESGGKEVNRAMVLAGWALAFRKFSDTYVAEEADAKAGGRGIWAGEFQPPWEFRSNKWQSASGDVPNSDCPIKGNINRKGIKIYHAPWSRSYKRTKINTTKGERWFCSEGEALAAGWRAPFR